MVIITYEKLSISVMADSFSKVGRLSENNRASTTMYTEINEPAMAFLNVPVELGWCREWYYEIASIPKNVIIPTPAIDQLILSIITPYQKDAIAKLATMQAMIAVLIHPVCKCLSCFVWLI